MVRFARAGDEKGYFFVAASCIAAKCWAPGVHVSRTSGREIPVCLYHARRGCPETVELRPRLEERRRARGWALVEES